MPKRWRLISIIYLTRGLSESADCFVRVHARDLVENQNFLLDLLSTPLGAFLKNVHAFNGITKKANYVPGLPEELKTALKTPTDPGAKPYAILIPIRKDAEWWLLDKETKTALMKEHTEASART